MKLTKAEREFLIETADGGSTAHMDFRPGRRLLALGLIEVTFERLGARAYGVTEAGRRALEGERDG